MAVGCLAAYVSHDLLGVFSAKGKVEHHYLEEGTAQAPDVDTLRVGLPHVHLGSDVERRAALSVQVRVRCAQRHLFGHPQVAELSASARDKDVIRFDVSVEDLQVVQVVEPGDELTDPSLDQRLLELLALVPAHFDLHAQILLVAVVHHDVEQPRVLKRLAEADQVRVVVSARLAHVLHLARQRRPARRPEVGEVLDLGHEICSALRYEHRCAKSAGPQFSQCLVALDAEHPMRHGGGVCSW